MSKYRFPLEYKLRTKDIAELTMCSIRTADRLKRCMKDLYKIEKVLYKHYLDYFGERELELKNLPKSAKVCQ